MTNHIIFAVAWLFDVRQTWNCICLAIGVSCPKTKTKTVDDGNQIACHQSLSQHTKKPPRMTEQKKHCAA